MEDPRNQENKKSDENVDKFNKPVTTTIKDHNGKDSIIILNEENNNNDDDDEGKRSTLKNNNINNNNDELKKDGEIIPFQSQIYIGNRRYKEQSSPPLGPSFNKRVRGLSTSNGMYYDSGRTRDDQYSYYHRNDYHPVPPPYIDHHIPYGRGLLNNNNNMSRRSSNAPPPLQSGRSTIPRPSDRLRNRY
nr:5393_t:CDS:2 [Entrophospora candida]